MFFRLIMALVAELCHRAPTPEVDEPTAPVQRRGRVLRVDATGLDRPSRINTRGPDVLR